MRALLVEPLLPRLVFFHTPPTHHRHKTRDCYKFIRLLELPPVLQISLNRYEFDNTQSLVKINQKFDFQEVLDFESILPNNKEDAKEEENG